MSRTHLLVYSATLGGREDVQRWADSCPLVSTWRYDLPHCFYLVSDATPHELSRHLEQTLGSDCRFLIAELSGPFEGRLPVDTWQFLKPKAELQQTRLNSV